MGLQIEKTEKGRRNLSPVFPRLKMGGAISTAARCVSSTKSDDFRLDTAIEYVLHPISLPPMEIIAYKGIKVPERFRKD